MSGFESVLSAARACGVDDDVATAPTVTPARRRQGRKSHPSRRTPSCPARSPASRAVRKAAGRSADDVHKGRHGLMQNLEWRSKGQSAHTPALRQSECRTLHVLPRFSPSRPGTEFSVCVCSVPLPEARQTKRATSISDRIRRRGFQGVCSPTWRKSWAAASTSLKRTSGGDYLGTNLERVREIVSVHLPALAAQMNAIWHEADPPV